MKYILLGILWLIVNLINGLWSFDKVSMATIRKELKNQSSDTDKVLYGLFMGGVITSIIWLIVNN